MTMPLLPGFGGSAPSMQAPPPPPVREDPAIAAAKARLLQAEKRRAGRRAAILTSGEGLNDELGAGSTIARPQARAGAATLGG